MPADELDQELDRRGHRFVRYADDAKVYVRSERAGQRVMASLCEFIQRRLRLKVNEAKSAVARPEERHFLGFRLWVNPYTGSVEVLMSERTKRLAMERIRQLTDGNGADVCIEAVGRPEVLQQAFYARDLAGTVVQVGVPTPDMALRLGKFCGNGADLWIRMQEAHDLWHAKRRIADELASIKTAKVA